MFVDDRRRSIVRLVHSAWPELPGAVVHLGWARSAREQRERTAETSEQPVLGVVHAAQAVVVDDRAGDPAVVGQHPRLRLDLLGREDAADRPLASSGSRLSSSR